MLPYGFFGGGGLYFKTFWGKTLTSLTHICPKSGSVEKYLANTSQNPLATVACALHF